jgi:hypothetical protein
VRRAAAAAAAIVAALAGCDAEDARPPPGTTTTTAPTVVRVLPSALPLAPTPATAARACRASRLLRSACPRRVPAGRYRSGDIRLAPVGAAGERFEFLVLVGRRTTAPRLVRLVVLASRYGLGRSVGGVFAAWPVARAIPVSRNRLRGELVHDRSDPSVRLGRLVVRWQSRGVDYAVALHAWKPQREAESTLRAVVASTTAAHGS